LAELRAGITGYSAYVPRFRLDRGEVAAVTGDRDRGARAVAAYDEDSTSLAVEAVRPAVAGTTVRSLWFGTTVPAYTDKTNATIVHAATGLPASVAAYDVALVLSV